MPELLVRGARIYTANLNPGHPAGTIQSIEHTLRSLDGLAAAERERIARLQKGLVDFQAQAGQAFEHEARLRELTATQAELNAALDLGKGDQGQIAQPADDGEADAGSDHAPAASEPASDPPRRRDRGRGRARPPPDPTTVPTKKTKRMTRR